MTPPDGDDAQSYLGRRLIQLTTEVPSWETRDLRFKEEISMGRAEYEGAGRGVVARLALVVYALILVASVACAVAWASVPGKNGQIAFRRYFDTNHHAGAIFTINSDGSGEQQVTRPPKGMYDEQLYWWCDGSLFFFFFFFIYICVMYA
ncbi:MAG: hypothetical protein M3P18_23045, partial [Actinomycetota bacterium]|nr:hypothetical protein [Actinomycetota bacterium]